MAHLIRLKGVLAKTGKTRTPLYNDIGAGLFPRPIRINTRAMAWPEHEADAVVKARIAGKTDDELKALVRRLEAERKAAA